MSQTQQPPPPSSTSNEDDGSGGGGDGGRHGDDASHITPTPAKAASGQYHRRAWSVALRCWFYIRLALPALVASFVLAVLFVVKPVLHWTGSFAFLVFFHLHLFFFPSPLTVGENLQVAFLGLLGSAVGCGIGLLCVAIGLWVDDRYNAQIPISQSSYTPYISDGARAFAASALLIVAFLNGLLSSAIPRFKNFARIGLFNLSWIITRGAPERRITYAIFSEFFYPSLLAAGAGVFANLVIDPKTGVGMFTRDLEHAFDLLAQLVDRSALLFFPHTDERVRSASGTRTRHAEIRALRAAFTAQVAKLRPSFDAASAELALVSVPILAYQPFIKMLQRSRGWIASGIEVEVDEQEEEEAEHDQEEVGANQSKDRPTPSTALAELDDPVRALAREATTSLALIRICLLLVTGRRLRSPTPTDDAGQATADVIQALLAADLDTDPGQAHRAVLKQRHVLAAAVDRLKHELQVHLDVGGSGTPWAGQTLDSVQAAQFQSHLSRPTSPLGVGADRDRMTTPRLAMPTTPHPPATPTSRPMYINATSAPPPPPTLNNRLYAASYLILCLIEIAQACLYALVTMQNVIRLWHASRRGSGWWRGRRGRGGWRWLAGGHCVIQWPWTTILHGSQTSSSHSRPSSGWRGQWAWAWRRWAGRAGRGTLNDLIGSLEADRYGLDADDVFEDEAEREREAEGESRVSPVEEAEAERREKAREAEQRQHEKEKALVGRGDDLEQAAQRGDSTAQQDGKASTPRHRARRRRPDHHDDNDHNNNRASRFDIFAEPDLVLTPSAQLAALALSDPEAGTASKTPPAQPRPLSAIQTLAHTLQRAPALLLRAVRTKEAIRLRVRMSQTLLGIKASRHLRFAVKLSVGCLLLTVPAWLGAPGAREWWYGERGQWALISYIWCLETSTGATVRVSTFRMIGTILGSVYGYVMWAICGSNAAGLVVFIVLAEMFAAYMMLETRAQGVGIVFGLTFPIIALIPYAGQPYESVALLAWERAFMVSIGILAALVVNTSVWPFHARVQLVLHIARTTGRLQRHYLSLSRQMLNTDLVTSQETRLAFERLERSILKALAQSRSLVALMTAEVSLAPKPTVVLGKIIDHLARIADLLVGLRLCRQHGLKGKIRKALVVNVLEHRADLISSILISFFAVGAAIRNRTPLPQFLPSPRLALDELTASLHEQLSSRGYPTHQHQQHQGVGSVGGGSAPTPDAYHALSSLVQAQRRPDWRRSRSYHHPTSGSMSGAHTPLSPPPPPAAGAIDEMDTGAASPPTSGSVRGTGIAGGLSPAPTLAHLYGFSHGHGRAASQPGTPPPRLDAAFGHFQTQGHGHVHGRVHVASPLHADTQAQTEPPTPTGALVRPHQDAHHASASAAPAPPPPPKLAHFFLLAEHSLLAQIVGELEAVLVLTRRLVGTATVLEWGYERVGEGYEGHGAGDEAGLTGGGYGWGQAAAPAAAGREMGR